ncbi:MAG: M56 family metallopeptidase [Lachnospiraceae bacterium]|nr:M56 family metallopeptidase [Lachnospiraceae bacterium]
MQNFLAEVIQNSIFMSCIILVYLVITKVFMKHYEAKWRYYSWVIPLTGMLFPIRPHIQIPIKSDVIPSVLSANTNQHFLYMQDTAKNIAKSRLAWKKEFLIIWIVGVGIIVAVQIWKHWKFSNLLKRWRDEITESHIQDIYQKIGRELHIKRMPKLMYCPCLHSPVMTGFFSPVVILPNKDDSSENLYFLLKHELVHYKRKDLWYKLLIVATITINWFNPIVYWMAREISIQCEISCDEEVLKKESICVRQKYGQLILSMIEGQSKIQTAFATNFNCGFYQTKERILCIKYVGRKKKGILLTGFMILAVVMTGLTFQIIDVTTYQPSVENSIVSQEEKKEDTSFDTVVESNENEKYKYNIVTENGEIRDISVADLHQYAKVDAPNAHAYKIGKIKDVNITTDATAEYK